MGMPRPPGGRRFLYFVVALLALNFLFASLIPNSPNRIEVPYTQFLDQVDKDNVKSVFAKGDSLQGTFKTKVDPQESDHKPETKFTTFRPAFAPSNDELLSELRQKGVVVTAKALGQRPLAARRHPALLRPDAAARRPLRLPRPPRRRRRRGPVGPRPLEGQAL